MSEAKQDKQRRWVFTLNNPEGQLDFSTSGVRLAVWQLEIGDNGTPHFQGYINFLGSQRMSGVKKAVGGEPHVEAARGTHAECVAYCTKTETRVEGPWYYPDEAAVTGWCGTGTRSDLAAACQMVIDGKPETEIEPVTFALHYRGLRALHAVHHPPPRRDKVRVLCIHGPPGIGKTTAVYNRAPSVFAIPLDKDALWFDGYCGQEAVLLDDYAGQLSISTFNRICDPFPYNAPVKGGFVAARWTTVYILCNAEPPAWYRMHQFDASIINAVYRRIGYGEWDGVDPEHVYVHYDSREEMEAGMAPDV